MARKLKAWRSEYNKQYYLEHRDREILRMRNLRKKLRDETFAAYGGYICSCCGETNPGFLSLDHIDGGGNEHRRAIGRKSGVGFQYWLKKNGFPPGFQVLCYNCNLGRAFAGGGVCPHKLPTEGVTGPQSHHYSQLKEIEMAKFKANPLGNLMGELVWNGVVEKGNAADVDTAPSFRAQVPVKDGLAAQDTFKQDAMKSTSRAEVEKRRMHLEGGADLKGADMFKELGGGTGGDAKQFTKNPAA